MRSCGLDRLGFAFVGLALACGPDEVGSTADASSGTDGGMPCVPGMVIACPCVGGTQGVQSCLSDGLTYGPCECGSTNTGNTATVGDDASVTSDDDDTSAGADTFAGTDDASESGSDSATGDATDTGGATLDGWTRRRPIVVDNALPYALTDFQLFVRLDYDSDMQVDFDDLRFTEADGASLLPHWTSRATPVEAEVWIRLPQVPAASTLDLWMYYGNPAAADASDGEATMFFVDEFAGNALDATKWGTTAPVAIVSGRLEVLEGAVYSVDPIIAQGQMLQARIQYSCCEGSTIPSMMTALAQADSSWFDFMRISDPNLMVQGSASGTIFPNMNVNLGGGGQVWYEIGLARDVAQVHFRRIIIPPNTLSFTYAMPGTHYAIFGDLQGATSSNMSAVDLWVDYAFVRTFAVADPTTTVGDEQELP